MPARVESPSEPSAGGDDFTALFRRFEAHVGRLAVRLLGNASEGDDIVQEVFLKAMRKLRTRDHDEAVRRWLTTTTVRLCRRRLRRRQYAQWLGFLPISEAAPAVAPTASEGDRLLVVRLYRVLDALPPAVRVAWILRHVAGEPLESVAALSGCSLATAKRRLAAAQREVDARLGRG